MMTCKPAVGLCIFFFMALNTKTHLKLNRLKTVFCLDIAMTFRAVQVCPPDMRLMTKFYKIRHPEYFDPLNSITGFIMFELLHKLGMGRNYIFMTEETFLHSGDACLP